MPKPAQASNKSQEDSSFGNQDEILLGVLTAIERDANTSQRMLSSELGVALGLANAYLKRCVRKGWVKIQQVPRRRYAYYLTPQGFSEKARLTGNYLSASFTFFRRARAQMSALMAECDAAGHRRIAFAGVSELAEVGILCAYDHDLDLAGIVDHGHAGEMFRGLKVVSRLQDIEPVDAVLITDLVTSIETYDALVEEAREDRLLIPPLLRLAHRHKSAESVQGAQ